MITLSAPMRSLPFFDVQSSPLASIAVTVVPRSRRTPCSPSVCSTRQRRTRLSSAPRSRPGSITVTSRPRSDSSSATSSPTSPPPMMATRSSERHVDAAQRAHPVELARDAAELRRADRRALQQAELAHGRGVAAEQQAAQFLAVEHVLHVASRNGRGDAPGAGRHQHRVGLHRGDRVRRGRGPRADDDGQARHGVLEVAHEAGIGLVGEGGDARGAAERRFALDQRHLVAAQRRDARGLEPGGSAADHDHALASFGGCDAGRPAPRARSRGSPRSRCGGSGRSALTQT